LIMTPGATAAAFVDKINEIILFPLIVLLMAIAMLVFIWGGFQYVAGASEPAKREEGRRHLLWGVIGFLVMVSAYAILEVAARTFGIDVDDVTNPTSTFAPSASPFPASRPATGSGSSGGASAAFTALQAQVVSDMTAANVDQQSQTGRWTAMTMGTPGTRLRAIQDARDLNYISPATANALITALNNEVN
jgi:hypothetical protein